MILHGLIDAWQAAHRVGMLLAPAALELIRVIVESMEEIPKLVAAVFGYSVPAPSDNYVF